MQRATCTGLRIRSPADARVIFHAVQLDIIPMVTRRLDTEERSLITPGSVYVWEERGPHAELTGVGIERWTDGIRWGPSRVREGFLFYHEKQDGYFPYTDGMNSEMSSSMRDPRSSLIKQTYTVFVDTNRGQRKWHLIAYFTEESLDQLQCIDDLPHLASLPVPHGKYKSARSTKGRPDHIFNPDYQEGEYPRIEVIQYKPKNPSSHSSSASPPERSTTSTTLRKWMNANHTSVTPSGRVKPTGLYTHTRTRSTPPEQVSGDNLAPLAYLQTVPPPRRYPEDEKTLMLLQATRRL